MKNGTVLFENVRFTVITESLIRCEYSKSKSFLDNDTLFAVNRKYNGCEYTACETENTVTVTTSEMSLTYKAGGECKLTYENGCNIITVSDMPVKEAVKVVLK